jgi:GNAT superfamily N-acetyltransferase
MNEEGRGEVMERFESNYKSYQISTDPNKLDITLIHEFLCNEAYWAAGRKKQTVKTSIQNSICFGVYDQNDQQVGLARVVTDFATIVWICDLFIIENHRGKGLGKWLVKTIVDHPDLKQVRRFLLATRDAHELYREYGGFEILPSPEYWMTRFIGEG